MMLHKVLMILIGICAGYLACSVANKQEGAKKTIGRLLGLVTIWLSLIVLFLNICAGFGCPLSSALLGKNCAMQKSGCCF